MLRGARCAHQMTQVVATRMGIAEAAGNAFASEWDESMALVAERCAWQLGTN